MKRFLSRITCVALLALVAFPAAAQCADLFGFTFNNGTIWQTGPRPGANGKRFLNVEGRNAGEFASYAVADVYVPTGGRTISIVNSLRVAMTQSNAAFTLNGRIRLCLTLDIDTPIDPPAAGEDPALRFDPKYVDGVGEQLGPLYDLGEVDFIQYKDGTMDVFEFFPEPEAELVLRIYVTYLNRFRLVVKPADEDVAATYAGVTNRLYPPPFVVLDVEFEK